MGSDQPTILNYPIQQPLSKTESSKKCTYILFSQKLWLYNDTKTLQIMQICENRYLSFAKVCNDVMLRNIL